MIIKSLALILTLGIFVQASEVQWSRFRGRVKVINAKIDMLTIQNGEGDLIAVKIDQDIQIERAKEQVKLSSLNIDDKVTLLYLPKAPLPKEEEPPLGGFYK